MYQKAWDKIWKDSRGRVVLWQTPNVWLISWAALTCIALLISGRPADIFSWIASGALIVWAWLEIFKGVNYFRRALGLLVAVYAIATLIKSI